MLTKEQYEKLKEKEPILRNAVKNDYVHLTFNEFKFYADIYAEITGKPLRNSQMNCNTCKLNALKKVGKEYFDFQEQKNNKRKAGRPPKVKDVQE